MTLSGDPSPRNLRLQWHISANDLQLKALKAAPFSEARREQYRQLEHERALLLAELKLGAEVDLLRKFDPDQPRVPAGNPDGGQWTGGGAGNDGTLSIDDPYGAQSYPGVAKPFVNVKPLINMGRAFFRRTTPAFRALDSLIQLLPDPELALPLHEALNQYNTAVAQNDSDSVAAISFRAWGFEQTKTPEKVLATTKELARDDVGRLCPKYWTVQTQTDLAAFSAGSVANYYSPATYGTAVHSRLEHQIKSMNDPI
ncbi:hypothetical protein HB779_10005 [Phyllobacterium sp. 628]|uniref:hypothetical protein n=1 Tax=Phyllobacterium sp. 628 TaxID=2718938 RepID=UPI0016624E59|nr:hypothetical protein [Phyllobacterium sp. 628]QND50696.1 hypothetical protein HB779_10005 [Phyllobacterium sp. 628]